VHNARKFSHVLGTTSFRNSIVIRPIGVAPSAISRNTRGSGDMRTVVVYDV
jgi:hypothetical protein